MNGVGSALAHQHGEPRVRVLDHQVDRLAAAVRTRNIIPSVVLLRTFLVFELSGGCDIKLVAESFQIFQRQLIQISLAHRPN